GEVDESALLRELDRKVRSAGLLRFSFSDAHGYPAGSPCVTFLEGVTSLKGPEDALAIVASLRRDSPPDRRGRVRVVPLMFDETDAHAESVAAVFIPPSALVHYFRSMSGLERF